VPQKAETYRQKAEECLRAAAGVSDPQAKATWLEMAQQWMLLATSRDQRAANDPKPDAGTTNPAADPRARPERAHNRT
jgi:hypothetical protein